MSHSPSGSKLPLDDSYHDPSRLDGEFNRLNSHLSHWQPTILTSFAQSPSDRAKKMLAQMSIDDKIALVHGGNGAYVGNVPANTRLGIPALKMNDGPQGFRNDGHGGSSTQWPSCITVAASFDPTLFRQWGVAMGKEFAGKGSNVQLGPGVNVARVPVNGRNFEYLSGEDPYL